MKGEYKCAILTADSIEQDTANCSMMFSALRTASSKMKTRRMRNDVHYVLIMCILPYHYFFSKFERRIHMSKKRFKIIDGPNGCFIKDTKGELATLPLTFSYSVLSKDNKDKLHEWLNFLNNKRSKKN